MKRAGKMSAEIDHLRQKNVELQQFEIAKAFFVEIFHQGIQ